ncbi:TPA: cytochrome ubiquinol oxidase subunit I, partial [Pseudomonas aeruginosa]|nr:cytochrome ubiquinol oxidase subunit I [Pseudomonas aeruginosa]
MANQSIHPITQPSGIAQARQNDPMFSKTISIKVIFALALAILMAWAGHSSVLLVGTTQVDWSSNGDA